MATEITHKMQKNIIPMSIPHIRRLHILMCPNISPTANVLIPLAAVIHMLIMLLLSDILYIHIDIIISKAIVIM